MVNTIIMPSMPPLFKLCPISYITLHKIIFRVTKITRTGRTLYELTSLLNLRILWPDLCFANRLVYFFYFSFWRNVSSGSTAGRNMSR